MQYGDRPQIAWPQGLQMATRRFVDEVSLGRNYYRPPPYKNTLGGGATGRAHFGSFAKRQLTYDMLVTDTTLPQTRIRMVI